MKKLSFFLVIVLVVVAVAGYFLRDKIFPAQAITLEEARTTANDFINGVLMQPGSEVEIKDVTEEEDFFKIVISMSGGQEFDSYLTKDGKKFFPQVMDIEEYTKQANAGQTGGQGAQETVDVPKKDKVDVELFVMSHCPYGTQIEKGILPVLEKLGSKINFTLKFCDYAMHDKKELDEQLSQYCIQKEQGNKLFAYLKCFLDSGSSAPCLKTAGIDESKLSACVKDADEKYQVSKLYADKATWSGGQFPKFNIYADDNQKYGVQGSPTLVVNGVQASAGRDPQSLLTVICSGFENAPEECSTKLSTDTPAPGFGSGTASSGSAAGCGQ